MPTEELKNAAIRIGAVVDAILDGAATKAPVRTAYENTPSCVEDGVPYVVIPEGHRVESLKDLLPPPLDRRASVVMQDAGSFIAYVNDFKTPTSRTFVLVEREKGASFNSILDYHTSGGGLQPFWGHHRVGFAMKTSPEWERWQKGANVVMSQVEFAEMIEERAHDFINPASGTMLDMAEKFEASRDSKYSSKVNRTSGDVTLSYEDETTTGQVKIPTTFTIFIPVFDGEEAQEVTIRLRYRVGGGGVKFHYEIENPAKLIDEAVTDVIERVAADTEIPTHRGTADLPKVND